MCHAWPSQRWMTRPRLTSRRSRYTSPCASPAVAYLVKKLAAGDHKLSWGAARQWHERLVAVRRHREIADECPGGPPGGHEPGHPAALRCRPRQPVVAPAVAVVACRQRHAVAAGAGGGVAADPHAFTRT